MKRFCFLAGVLPCLLVSGLLAQAPTPGTAKPTPAKPAASKPSAPKPAGVKPAGAKPAAARTTPRATPGAKTAAPLIPLPEQPGLYATLQTSMGNILLRMYENESPITVKNFKELALGQKTWPDPKTGQRVRRPLFNGTVFHRVIPDFMIQGGDPQGDGTGGSDDIPDEFHPSLRFDRPGLVAMANRGPGTGSSQFFITEKATTWLTGKHTIFGEVVVGQDVVEKIARVPASPDNNRPLTPVVIQRVTMARVGPGEPVEGARPAPARRPGSAKPKPTAAKPAA